MGWINRGFMIGEGILWLSEGSSREAQSGLSCGLRVMISWSFLIFLGLLVGLKGFVAALNGSKSKRSVVSFF